MARYHDTGTKCNAEKRSCPLGLSAGEHIEAESQEEFERKLEAKLKDEYGSSATMGSVSRLPLDLKNSGWTPETLEYSRDEFSKGRGEFLLVNEEDGYVLSDNCVVIEAEGIDPESYDDMDAIGEAIEREGVPIQDLDAVGRMNNPLLVEPDTGAVSSPEFMYAVKISDEIMPEDLYESEDSAREWAYDNGFPLFDDEVI